MSGCKKSILYKIFGTVPGLGIVAEHGYFIRWNHASGKHRMSIKPVWDPLWTDDVNLPASWKSRVRHVMDMC